MKPHMEYQKTGGNADMFVHHNCSCVQGGVESREHRISQPGSVDSQQQTGEPTCKVGKASARPPASGLPGGVRRELAEILQISFFHAFLLLPAVVIKQMRCFWQIIKNGQVLHRVTSIG